MAVSREVLWSPLSLCPASSTSNLHCLAHNVQDLGHQPEFHFWDDCSDQADHWNSSCERLLLRSWLLSLEITGSNQELVKVWCRILVFYGQQWTGIHQQRRRCSCKWYCVQAGSTADSTSIFWVFGMKNMTSSSDFNRTQCQRLHVSVIILWLRHWESTRVNPFSASVRLVLLPVLSQRKMSRCSA